MPVQQRPSGLAKRRETKWERNTRLYKDGDAYSIITNTFGASGLSDNTAATLITVVIPNGIATAILSLTVGGGLGDGDSCESSTWTIAFSRIAGAAAKCTVGAKATNAATTGAAGNAAVTVSAAAVVGANTATQTFAIQAKVARSAGTADNHDICVEAQLFCLRGGVIMQ